MPQLLSTYADAPAPGDVEVGPPAVRRSRSHVTDAAEPWEIPVPKADRFEIDRWLPGRPFRPSKSDDVPEQAMAALESTCGRLPLERLFVVPRTTRLVSHTECVITPAKVLAFGEAAVGLWVDDGPAGRVMSSPIDRLLAVDDRTILLYGRLRLISAAAELVIRYNTVSRDELQPNLRELRRLMAACEDPVESTFLWLGSRTTQTTPSDLPHKWRVLLESPAVRPYPMNPAAIAVGDVSPVRRGRRRAPSGIALLGSRELVIANEPSEYLDDARYGVDLLAVPRGRLDSLGWDGRALTVRLSGEGIGAGSVATEIAPLDPLLVEAMKRSFGPEVRWS